MNRKTNWKKAGILLAMLVFCVSSILISTISVEAAKSPIAYWKLSENGETQVKDYSGNGKDGNIRGLAAWINGIKGKAINLLVSSSYIETTPSILEKGTWSYETWVRPGLTVGEACIYTEKNPDMKISITENNCLKITTWNCLREGNLDSFQTKPNVIKRGKWNYVVVTLKNAGQDAGSGEVKCYVNGVLVDKGDLGVGKRYIAVTGVTVDKPSMTLTSIGATGTLTATVSPPDAINQNIDWSSGKPNIASVDNGVVTAKEAGTTNIWACSNENSSISAKCIVTVEIPVSSVSVSPSSIELVNGQTKDLSAKVYPSNATNSSVSWSSNSSLVTVNEDTGEITAAESGTGTAIITATAGGKKDTCIVRVPQIILSNDSLVLDNWADTYELQASVSPDDISNEIEWSSDDTNSVFVSSDGVVTPKYPGSATITAKLKNNPDVYATCSVTVNHVYIPVTGVVINPGGMTLWNAGTGQPSAFTVTAHVIPEYADDKRIKFYSTNTSVATISIDGGVVYQYGKKGQWNYCDIIAKSVANPNATDSCSIQIWG